MRKGGIIFIVLVLSVIFSSYNAISSEFSLNGFLSFQYGVFIGTEHNKVEVNEDGEKFPKDHGDFWGLPSIARNTLQLEADWKAQENLRLHSVFRGVLSASLEADRYAQVPDLPSDKTYNHDDNVQEAKIKWVHEHYYNEADVRELYLDFDATDWLNFRIGRQQVSWGETGSYQTLDVINPINSTWHLSIFEEFEDIRVPLWIAKTLIQVPFLNGDLETVWVPCLDKPENLVTVPLTFVGAWGLPLPPENDYVSNLKVVKKTLIYPDNDLSDSRLGVRWKGVLGGFTYTLVYYYTHQLTPPIPFRAEQDIHADSEGYHNAEVFLKFPRQNIYGFSMDYAFQSPVSLVVRVEAKLEPDRTFPVNSYLSPGTAPDGGEGWKNIPGNPDRIWADIYSEERPVLSYALVLQRPNIIRWLNPTSSIITQFQILQSFLLDPNKFQLGTPYIKDEISGEINPNWYIIDIPGYDVSKVNPMTTTFIFAALTNYFHGFFNPVLIAGYIPGPPEDREIKNFQDFADFYISSESVETASGFLSLRFNFVIGNNWRITLGLNEIFGGDPYKGLGMFRDRDEVYTKIKIQF